MTLTLPVEQEQVTIGEDEFTLAEAGELLALKMRKGGGSMFRHLLERKKARDA